MFSVGVEEYTGYSVEVLYGMHFDTKEEAQKFALSVMEDGELRSFWINMLTDEGEYVQA